MRRFNTSGPCDPEKHYTLIRQWLLDEGKLLVESGRYFTLFAPRQAGKTTYFQLLLQQLESEGYTPLWISFEGFKTLPRERFYVALDRYLRYEFTLYGIDVDVTIEESSCPACLSRRGIKAISIYCHSDR